MTLFLAFTGLFVTAQSLPAGQITLDQALSYADQNAFAILIQQTRVEKQRQEAAAAAGALGPKATLGGTYTRFNQAATASFGAQTFTIVPIQELVGTASIGMPIDISGNMRRLIRASKADQYAQEETLQATRSDTRRQVRTAYYGVLRAQSEVKVAQETLESDTARATNVEQRYKQGIVAQVDLLRAQTQQAGSESNLIVAKNDLELAKQNFNNLLARPIDTPVEVVDVAVPDMKLASADLLTNQAEKTRHEAKALEHTVQALGFVRRATEQGNLPTLNVGVNYQDQAKPTGFGQLQQLYTGQVALNFPIYDSGVTRANVKAARQDEAQAQVQLKQVRLQISLDVQQATKNFETAKSRVAVAERQVSTAQVVLKQAQLRLEQGVGILLEVVDAQRDLTNAEYTQVAAKYDLLQAIADLERAVGDDNLPSG